MADKNANLDKLDAIKEIIFGENIKQYESAFQKLEEEFSANRKDAKKDVADLRKELVAALEKLNAYAHNLGEKLKEQEDQKVSKAQLSDILARIAGELKPKK